MRLNEKRHYNRFSFISADFSTTNTKQSIFLYMPAGDEMFGSAGNRHKRRILGKTPVAGKRTSRVKRASGGRIKDAGNFAFKPVR
jgi:hypothetical protein